MDGGAGFLGSALVRELVSQSTEVIVFDNFSAGTEANLFDVYDKISIVRGDILSSSFAQTVKTYQPDIVFHLAAEPFIPDAYNNPERFFETNIRGTLNVLSTCALFDTPKIVNYSSSEVYGSNLFPNVPMDETHPTLPHSTYAVSKLAADRLCHVWAWERKMPIVNVRPFNCFDATTEVLTDSGWSTFQDLNGTEKIATLNPSTDLLEYQNMTARIDEPYSGKMVKVTGRQVDHLVTPNHRMWVKPRFPENGGYGIVEAAKLLERAEKTKPFTFQLSADWNPSTYPDKGKSPRKWSDRVWIRFLAWYLSEGSVNFHPRYHGIQIRQTKNGAYLAEIFAIVRKMSQNPHIRFGMEGRVQFSHKEIHDYLLQFGRSRDKFIPDEIKRLPKDLLRLFINTYQKGDGSRGYWNGYLVNDSITSFSPRMLDDLQEIILKAGWASTVNGHLITIARENTETAPSTAEKFTAEWYDGRIGCVTVPNSLIYVRRNGRASVAGNCFGPRETQPYIIPEIIRQLAHPGVPGLSKTARVRLGNLDARRDFTYAEDHARAVRMLAEKGKNGETYNIGTGENHSVGEIVAEIASLMDIKAEIHSDKSKMRPYDVEELLCDASKIEKLTNWKPEIPFRTGLKLTIRHCLEAGAWSYERQYPHSAWLGGLA